MSQGQLAEEKGSRKENDKEFSFFRNLVPSPLKADADFMMSAMMSADGQSQIKNTSESGFSNNLLYRKESAKKRGEMAQKLQVCSGTFGTGAQESEPGSPISALTEEPQYPL